MPGGCAARVCMMGVKYGLVVCEVWAEKTRIGGTPQVNMFLVFGWV
jgi:hypothetical protein